MVQCGICEQARPVMGRPYVCATHLLESHATPLRRRADRCADGTTQRALRARAMLQT